MNKLSIIIPILVLFGILLVLLLVFILKKRSNFKINYPSNYITQNRMSNISSENNILNQYTLNKNNQYVSNTNDFNIFIINLDKRPDRLIECEQEILNYNLQNKYNFKRIKAVDGENYLNSNKLNENILKRFWDTTENSKWDKSLKPNVIKQLSPGEVGCCLSHFNVWNEIKNKNMDYALVLEDDFKFNKNYHENLLNMSINFVEKNHKNIDILYLGGIDNSKFSTKSNYKFGFNKSDFIFCTYSYIITKRGIDKLMRSLPMIGSVDLFMASKLDSYRIQPFIISQRYPWNIKSDIAHSAHNKIFNVN